jgi:hypothetical protein
MAANTLVVMTNCVLGCEGEYNARYDDQHLGDFLRLGGFVSAHRSKLCERHQALDKYMALQNLECEDPGAALVGLTKHANTLVLAISEAMDANVSVAPYAAITPVVTG